MKKSIFLSFILCLCLVTCIPQQAMAQKQSRMEKLLRYLNDNDADKWQKNREKLDDETKAYYAEELSLMDVLNDLWNKQSEQAATLYFGCYEKAAQSYFPGICEGEKIQLSNIREKADQSIISLLEASKDKIPFSRGEENMLKLSLKNRGFATVFGEHPVYFVLIDKEGEVTEFPTDANPLNWQPFEPNDSTYTSLMHTVNLSLKLPASIPAGTYQLGLWIPDGSDRLRYNPRYAIHCANGDTDWWISRDGKYGVNVLTIAEVE